MHPSQRSDEESESQSEQTSIDYHLDDPIKHKLAALNANLTLLEYYFPGDPGICICRHELPAELRKRRETRASSTNSFSFISSGLKDRSMIWF